MKPDWFDEWEENHFKTLISRVARIEVLTYLVLGAIIASAIALLLGG